MRACVETDREELLPEVLFLGFSFSVPYFKGKSSILGLKIEAISVANILRNILLD